MREKTRHAFSFSRTDTLVVALLMVVLSLLLYFYSLKQPRIRFNNGRGDDGVHYAQVAEAFVSENVPVAPAPFVYRIGTPFVASLVTSFFGTSIDQAFFVVNLCTLYILTILTYLFFRLYLSAGMALALTILFLLPYHAPPRWLIFYPVLVDNLWSVFMMGSLIVMSTPAALSWKGILFLTVSTIIATLTREVGLLIPVLLILSLYSVRRYFSLETLLGEKVDPTNLDSSNHHMDLLKSLIPLAAGIAVFVAIRFLVSASGDYRFALAAYRSLQKTEVPYLLQTAFVAFGPLIVLPFVDRKNTGAHLRKTSPHLIFLIAILALAMMGGTNTVRFLYWGSAVVLLLIGISLQNIYSRVRQSTPNVRIVLSGLLIVLIFLQIANTHFWHGFYDDYSAWEQWGGLHLSRLNPFYIAGCMVLCILTMLLFGRFLQSSSGNQIETRKLIV